MRKLIFLMFFLMFGNAAHALSDVAPKPVYKWSVGGGQGFAQYDTPEEVCQVAADADTSGLHIWGIAPEGSPYPPTPTQVACVYVDKTGQGLSNFQGWIIKAPICTGAGSEFYKDSGLGQCKCRPGDYWIDEKKVCATPDPNQPDPNKEPSPCPHCGNPIIPANGAKIQKETDFVVASSGFSFDRFYNGSVLNIDENTVRLFGRHWITRFDSRILQEYTTTNMAPNAYCFASFMDDRKFCLDRAQEFGGIPDIVSVSRPNGERQIFSMVNGVGVSSADVTSRLRVDVDNYGNAIWTFVDGNTDDIEKYNNNGKLLSISTRAGITQSLTYATGDSNDTAVSRMPGNAPICKSLALGKPPYGTLLCVTDNWGNQIQIVSTSKGISKVIAPDNQVYTYTYDGAPGGCTWTDRGVKPNIEHNFTCDAINLTGVTYPDGKSKQYHYNETDLVNNSCRHFSFSRDTSMLNSLTGIVDENGVRFATWSYDCLGRANMSQHAGGVEKVTLDYGFQGEGHSLHSVRYFTGTDTNPGSSATIYAYDWVAGVAKYRGTYEQCVGCPATTDHSYDANGNLKSQSDWNGNVTSFEYDLSRNLVVKRTEAFNTSQALTTTTSWHPNYRLPMQINAPLLRTTYTYDAKGNMLTRTEQATGDTTGSQGANASVTGTARTWTYTYNNVGQVLTVTGPRTDVVDKTTYAYDSQGNVSSITNGAGHVTSMSNYDGNGRVGQITDPNGLVTTFSYTPRGWLSQRVTSGDGVSETTSYQYDGVGQIVKITLPDSSNINYIYDDAHRLTKVSDSLGNSINYTLDNMGNRINETVTDSGGNLTRQITRVYDTFNRLQKVTGAAQ